MSENESRRGSWGAAFQKGAILDLIVWLPKAYFSPQALQRGLRPFGHLLLWTVFLSLRYHGDLIKFYESKCM